MTSSTTSVSHTRLRSFQMGQRVLVVVDERERKVDAPGTVVRVCSDGGAWVALDARHTDERVHPFPVDDSRGMHVKAYPDGCEAAIESASVDAGNRKTRKSKKWTEVAKAAHDASVPAPTMATFGKDHWSTFAYIETVVVDHRGEPDKRRMRCIAGRHPMQDHGHDASAYTTRLKGGIELHNHDDWDCLEDCEREGLLVNDGTDANPHFTLTPLGQEVAKQLRVHKSAGKNFASFEPVLAANNG